LRERVVSKVVRQSSRLSSVGVGVGGRNSWFRHGAEWPITSTHFCVMAVHCTCTSNAELPMHSSRTRAWSHSTSIVAGDFQQTVGGHTVDNVGHVHGQTENRGVMYMPNSPTVSDPPRRGCGAIGPHHNIDGGGVSSNLMIAGSHTTLQRWQMRGVGRDRFSSP
jgi:hypothetical protein